MKNNKTNKMKISDWLDAKEAENLDVSQIAVPEDLSYDEVPDETIFSKRLILAGFSVQEIIPFLRSSDLDTGIIAEVETRRPVFIHQKWSGGCLQKIEISLSKRLKHT